MKLTPAEEEIMEVLWRQGPSFMKDLLEALPEPKPAPTTVATLLKRMQEKGAVGYKTFGNSRQYTPLVKKEAYFSRQLKGLIKNFFGNSSLQFASFFTSTSQLSEGELKELRKIIDAEIKKRQ